MIDKGLAKQIKEMNRTVEVLQVSYYDDAYKLSKNYSLVIVEFVNGHKFEINKETFQAQFRGYIFRMKKGGQ